MAASSDKPKKRTVVGNKPVLAENELPNRTPTPAPESEVDHTISGKAKGNASTTASKSRVSDPVANRWTSGRGQNRTRSIVRKANKEGVGLNTPGDNMKQRFLSAERKYQADKAAKKNSERLGTVNEGDADLREGKAEHREATIDQLVPHLARHLDMANPAPHHTAMLRSAISDYLSPVSNAAEDRAPQRGSDEITVGMGGTGRGRPRKVNTYSVNHGEKLLSDEGARTRFFNGLLKKTNYPIHGGAASMDEAAANTVAADARRAPTKLGSNESHAGVRIEQAKAASFKPGSSGTPIPDVPHAFTEGAPKSAEQVRADRAKQRQQSAEAAAKAAAGVNPSGVVPRGGSIPKDAAEHRAKNPTEKAPDLGALGISQPGPAASATTPIHLETASGLASSERETPGHATRRLAAQEQTGETLPGKGFIPSGRSGEFHNASGTRPGGGSATGATGSTRGKGGRGGRGKRT